jgi:hypothetical protein
MNERTYTPERSNPEEFYAEELNRHIRKYFERFGRGEIDRATIHKELRDGIEAALQAIEASR